MVVVTRPAHSRPSSEAQRMAEIGPLVILDASRSETSTTETKGPIPPLKTIIKRSCLVQTGCSPSDKKISLTPAS